MEVIQNKEHWVLHRLTKFYSNPDTFEKIETILTGKSKTSLRLIDWFVTNFAKKFNIAYTLKEKHIIVYLEYKSHLKAYSKKLFDPFCRSHSIKFRGIDTSIGQLNFFEWALQDNILSYIEEHYDEIHKDMEDNSILAVPVEGERRKRRELSKSATNTVRHHEIKVVVNFE